MGLDKYIPGVATGVTPNPLVIDVTYAELVDKIASSQLIPGQKYRITDYRTAYNMPNVTPTEKIVCTVEPLLVTANSVNTLSMYAYSEAFPQDEIYYDIANNQTMVPGCDMGYIYRRVDKLKNIDIGFDWRYVKFRRWRIDVDAYDAGVTYAKYTIVRRPSPFKNLYISLVDGNVGNAITDVTKWKQLFLLDETFISPYPTEWILANVKEEFTAVFKCGSEYQDLCMFAISNTGLKNISIAQNTSDIIVNSNTVFTKDGSVTCQNFIVKSAFKNNTFIDIAIDSVIDGIITENLLLSDFSNNKVMGTFNNNLICQTFRGNEVVTNCSLNIFVSNILNNKIYSMESVATWDIIDGCEIISWGASDCLAAISNAYVNMYFADLETISLTTQKKSIYQNNNGDLICNYINEEGKLTPFDILNNVSIEVKEYTALLSETGYAATSGLLVAGQTYYIASYVAGDDFTNVGGTNVTGNTFVASGTTPTAWTNSSILVSVGISAPAVTLLTNGLSGAIVWTYSAVGTYIGTLSGAFTENKTVFSYPPLGDDKAVTVEWTSANVITVKTYETGALKDGLLVKFPLTIKVYP